MADYIIQSETLDNIANAINAKTGESSAMTPAQMVTEIASISGGGGSLPPSISKIDGGEITFTSTTVSTYQITHSLGVVPRGFVIWADDINITVADNNICIRGVFVVDKSSDESITSFLYQDTVYNHNFNSYTRNVGNNFSSYANANYISYNVSNIQYIANASYKWFAWA